MLRAVILFALLTTLPGGVESCRAQAQGSPISIPNDPNTWPHVEHTDPLVTPFDAPWQYRQWWAEDEKCSGLKGDFDHWNFAAVNASAFRVNHSDMLFIGYTWSDTHTIYLVAPFKMNPLLVKHEMIHALMDENNMPAGHPDSLFNRKCGRL
jgi:hypothetical protein